MSAQAGVCNFNGEPVDPALVHDLAESLKALGPDGSFVHVDDPVALVYRPFHTTRESRRERQPHVLNDVLVTWDGRLDNRDELIDQLQLCHADNPTDIAIAATAFERWHTACFRKLLGDWAIVICNPKLKELFLAVDYMSVKHLFYHVREGRLWWATDLNPLVLLSRDVFHLDDEYIAGYFANNPDGHLTPYREIAQVPPGHFVRVRDGIASCHRYWQPSPKLRLRYKSDADYEDHFRDIFRKSVRRRLRSDSPVLAELSGGLDSSSIVCMADDIHVREPTSSPRIGTLSYYDQGEHNTDDSTYFRMIEQRRGMPGDHIDNSKFGNDQTLIRVPYFVALPGMTGLTSELNIQRAGIVRSGGYKVVLSGVGGDEFLGGIPDPRSQLADLAIQLRLVALVQQLTRWSLVKRKPVIKLAWECLVDILPRGIQQFLVDRAEVAPWIERAFARRTRLSLRQVDVDNFFGFLLPSRRSYVAGLMLMSNYIAKSLLPVLGCEEVRYPYLDRELIEFILAIPAEQLLRPGERRSLMRRSLRGIVPAELLSRRTKSTSYRTPLLGLEKHVDELRLAFESPLISDLGYVGKTRFIEAFEAARNGKPIHIVRLMRTVSMEFWLKELCERGLLGLDGAREPSQPRPGKIPLTA
jgi:asparagine synthase (glutamine-hydrolysing)